MTRLKQDKLREIGKLTEKAVISGETREALLVGGLGGGGFPFGRL